MQTINDAMKETVYHFISVEGVGCEISSSEIKEYIYRKYDIPKTSVLPPDYCYNRINKGTPVSHPVYFEYLETNRYRCLGENYPYNGKIYHKAKMEKQNEVGECINGKRILYDEKGFFKK